MRQHFRLKILDAAGQMTNLPGDSEGLGAATKKAETLAASKKIKVYIYDRATRTLAKVVCPPREGAVLRPVLPGSMRGARLRIRDGEASHAGGGGEPYG